MSVEAILPQSCAKSSNRELVGLKMIQADVEIDSGQMTAFCSRWDEEVDHRSSRLVLNE